MDRFARAALAVALAASSAAAGAQDRPAEEEMFGAPSAPQASPAGKPAEGAPSHAPGQPAPEAAPAPAARGVSKEREDPLRIGGMLYLRAATSAREGEKPGDWSFSSPDLMDVYLDVRPNDRVRGFVLGRMFYDATAGGAQAGVPGLGGATSTANPSAVLDQLWVNFDVARTLFVTAGKQHVKWGVGRLWNPTDWLHRQRRDPLAILDVRSGATMVKLHLPWEKRGWNLYAIALLEDLDAKVARPASVSTGLAAGSRLAYVAGGARAEIVLGNVEIGADALVKDGHRPRFGFDVSAGIWDFDVHAELALRTSSGFPRWREVDPTARLDLRWAEDHRLGLTPAVVAGAEWSHKYSDEDAVFVGAEYFFDDSGYSDPHVYPFLLTGAPIWDPTLADPTRFTQRDPAAFTPFYLGRHYAGAYVRLPSPGRWNDTTFVLSGVGNLTDRSFVVRLDHSVQVLTYLRVETFVAGHLGAKGGELRLGIDVPAQTLSMAPPLATPAFHYPPPVVDAGIALRVSL